MDLTRFADEYWSRKDDRVDYERLELIASRVPAGAAVLVIDGGPGMLAAVLRDRGFRVQMTDLSAHAVARARAKGLEALQVDTDDAPVPFSDGAFDCVISDSAIEHRYYPAKALAESVRVLRPGGSLLLLVPNIAHWRHRLWLLGGRFPEIPDGPSDPCHLRHFAAPELRRLLRGQSLEIMETLGFPSLWVKGLYPRLFRASVVKPLYFALTRLRPTLFGRDLLFVCRKPSQSSDP